MPKAQAGGGKVSSAVKKGAIALASLAGLALLAKHRDKLPGLMQRANVGLTNASYRLKDKWNKVGRIGSQEWVNRGWHNVNVSDADEPAATGGPVLYKEGKGLWDKVKKVAKVALPVAGAVGAAYAGNKLTNRKTKFPAIPWDPNQPISSGWEAIQPSNPRGKGLSGGSKSLKALKRLGLTASKKTNSLRHIAGNGILESPDYQESAVAIHDRLKRLPEKSELKQDAYHVGGMLLGAGVSNRKNHSKRNKLLASSALLSLGTKHNKEVTGNSLKVLKKQKNRAEEIAAYLKSIPRATNDFYKDRMELAKQNESQPPVDSSPQQPAPGKGIGNLVGLMSKPRRKGQGIKDKLKKAAKVILPAAAAAAAAYAGKKYIDKRNLDAALSELPLQQFSDKVIKHSGAVNLMPEMEPHRWYQAIPEMATKHTKKRSAYSVDDLIARRMLNA
jgi:hypothetical protein